ncbi:MAG: hypothetical protein GY731_02860 [Gammaproteobacteria bacterium]|nr:hypothetical protein [Gammaproteobacteria bacterium]
MSIMLAGCGSDEDDSPEAQLTRFVASGRVAAEARSIESIGELVSDDYRDEAGRDKRALLRLTTIYFLRNKNIHLLTRIRNINSTEEDRAGLTVFVAMAGTPVVDAKALLNIRADLFRFDFRLRKEEGDWQLTGAAWRPARKEDFLNPVL